MYVRDHIINAYMTYHSYGELLLWPWDWTGNGTPDSIVYTRWGVRIAGMMNKLGGGSYTPGQSYINPYPTSGGVMTGYTPGAIGWDYHPCLLY